MKTIENPAPLAGGNRVKQTDSIDGEIKSEYSPFPHCEQLFQATPYGLGAAIAAAPDENSHRIICLHWNIPSKQKLRRETIRTEYQPGLPANDNRRAGQ